MSVKLYDDQLKAVEKLTSGKILCGKVGSGKSLTALFFYKKEYPDRDLYVITTAKKRNDKDWEEEASKLGIKDITVDSWNNIKKYKSKQNSFFIFDEQRVGGFGKWARTYIQIARNNLWILLSATPGDVWTDYISVFIANGFYRNKTEFIAEHVEYDRFVTYPKVKAYHNVPKLMYYRDKIIVTMADTRRTRRHKHYELVGYDKRSYDYSLKYHWDVLNDVPVENASQMTQLVRRIVATSDERIERAKDILESHDKIICFYNYNYELDILRSSCEALKKPYAEWNGHKHEDIPSDAKWAYIVHYAAAEGWNCTETDSMLFYSMNYSYKVMEQAEGRIDRMNTEFEDLHYYYLISNSSIDGSIMRALKNKKKFNEGVWGNKCLKVNSKSNSSTKLKNVQEPLF